MGAGGDSLMWAMSCSSIFGCTFWGFGVIDPEFFVDRRKNLKNFYYFQCSVMTDLKSFFVDVFEVFYKLEILHSAQKT